MEIIEESRSYDAIVTAGDRGASKFVYGRNKVFLEIREKPLIFYVIGALEESERVKHIHIVGPQKDLEKVFEQHGYGKKPLSIYEQQRNLYENVWNAFLHTLPGYQEGSEFDDSLQLIAQDKAILVVPGDAPLLTPFEVDEFLSQCDLGKFDYFLGLTSEDGLKPYYPDQYRRGIKLAYYHFRDERYRHNNLHLVKVLRVANREYIQKMYDSRYQKEWKNILKLGWEILRVQQGGIGLLKNFLSLHMANLMSRFRLEHVEPFSRVFISLPEVEATISKVLATRFTTVNTSYGGATLDIDNEEQYEIIKENFEVWREYQYNLYKEKQITHHQDPKKSKKTI
ncbi:MAG: NTP transferase domain-containing protein [Candidatus Tectomicrobia bacterium]|nr:NTP transferase domain-containing protein [Candidatus Tectomicrobia bacterium]